VNGHHEDDLAGEVTDRVTYDPMLNSAYVQRTQALGRSVKYVAYVQIPAELVEDIRDAAAMWHDILATAFDRAFRPWLFPDRNPMPYLNWWPWLSRRRR
jgi:hypothetical protein